MIYMGYCGYCSMEAVDIRILIKEDKTITCTHCGGKTDLIPIYEDSPYYKLVRRENVKRQR